MLLSGLDSKKYQSILRFKRSLKETPELFTDAILSENRVEGNREIDKYGEIVATKVIDKRKNFSREQIDTIVRLRKSGETLVRIADKFDCGEFTIRKILKKCDYQS
jgi:hypothetical protein